MPVSACEGCGYGWAATPDPALTWALGSEVRSSLLDCSVNHLAISPAPSPPSPSLSTFEVESLSCLLPLCCVLQASCPVSFQLSLMSLPPVSPYECYDCRCMQLVHLAFMWVLRMQLGSSGLCCKLFHGLNYLSDPIIYLVLGRVLLICPGTGLEL